MGRHLSNHSPSPDRGRGSPRRRRSPPPAERSPTRHRSSRGDISPVREKRLSRSRSAKREMSRSPSPVALKKNSRRDSSPSVKEKRRERSGSPSPRTKRLRQALAEKEVDRRTDRDHGRNHERVKDRANHRDKEGSKVSERERERSHEKGGERGARKGRDDEMVIERENDKNRGRGSDRTTYKDRDTDKGNRADRKEKSHGRDEIEEKPSRGRHEHSASPSDRRHRRRRSHSPQTLDDNRQHDEVTNDRGADKSLGRNDEDDSVAKMKAAEEALEAKKQQKPSFELSGKLAEETNRFRGITLLFNEPPEARKPTIRWRLYVFKGGEVLNEPLYIHRQSCYLFGRERRVADIPTDHPSCSKQHAVIQYRQIEQEGADGTISKQVRPYIMDLGSTNKTFINESAIEPQRYYELFERDTIKFGNSSREYVLLHENSSEA
ncbi:FHA domain-containing protein DDL [Linum perenne]